MTDRITITTDMIEATFDGAAPFYDAGKMFRDSGRILADMLPIQPGSKVLDIGCGTGAVLLPVAHRVGPNGRVTGIDISESMLRHARSNMDRQGMRNSDLRRMDASRLEFPDASFDAITCAFALFYFPRTALAEMHRVCRPGGTVGISVFETWTPDLASPATIVNDLIREYRENDPNATFARFQYGWPTRFSVEEIDALLIEYGFRDPKTSRSTVTAIYENSESFWEMLLSGGSRLTLMSMEEETRNEFKIRLMERLIPVTQLDGIHLTETALYSVASR